jgi:hypothetical protein
MKYAVAVLDFDININKIHIIETSTVEEAIKLALGSHQVLMKELVPNVDYSYLLSDITHMSEEEILQSCYECDIAIDVKEIK